MILAFHDYSLEPKITKCGDLLYSCYIHGKLHILYEQNFLLVKIISWNFQYIFVWFRIFLCGIKVARMSWNFVRFNEIINPINAEDFWFLSWQTKKAMYYTQWHEILSKVAFIKYFILKCSVKYSFDSLCARKYNLTRKSVIMRFFPNQICKYWRIPIIFTRYHLRIN